MDLADRRDKYETDGLDVGDVDADPMAQFEQWYREAEAAELWEPNAMVVSAVDADGWPTSRYVLLKGFDARGFVFYTNYESEKAAALEGSGKAALTFGWLPLRRQIRIQGWVERVSTEESDAYFARRPRGSRLGAWASPQSAPIADRAALDARYDAVVERFGGADGDRPMPRPEHWGGYRVVAERIEFWQGRPDRFHDRLRYHRDGDGWTLTRLAP